MRPPGSLRAWGWFLLAAGLSVNGLRGVQILGSGLLLGLLVGTIAWSSTGRLPLGILSAGLAQGLVVAPSLTLASATLGAAVVGALLVEDPRVLLLAGVGLLLPAPVGWMVPLVGAGLLWTWGSPGWRWAALPLGGAPIMANVGVAEGAAGLGAALVLGEIVRRVADARANLRQARLLADLGLLAAPGIGVGALVMASVADLPGFVAVLRWTGLTLAAALIGSLAHIGAAAGLRTDTEPRVWLGLTWLPAGTVLGFGLAGSLSSVLGHALSVASLATPAAALGLAALLGPFTDPAPASEQGDALVP